MSASTSGAAAGTGWLVVGGGCRRQLIAFAAAGRTCGRPCGGGGGLVRASAPPGTPASRLVRAPAPTAVATIAAFCRCTQKRAEAVLRPAISYTTPHCGTVLADPLLVTIGALALLALVRGDLLAFALLTATHTSYLTFVVSIDQTDEGHRHTSRVMRARATDYIMAHTAQACQHWTAKPAPRLANLKGRSRSGTTWTLTRGIGYGALSLLPSDSGTASASTCARTMAFN